MHDINAAITRYFAAIRAFDADAWLDCYSPDAVVNDPADSPPRQGSEAHRAFFASFAALFSELDFQPQQVFICGNEAAVQFHARCIARNGKRVEVEGIDVFGFDAAGRIRSQRGYWDPTPLMAAALVS